MHNRKKYEEPKTRKPVKRDGVIMAILIAVIIIAGAGIVAYDHIDAYSKLDYDKVVKLGKYKGLEGTMDKAVVTDKDVRDEIDRRIEDSAKTKTVKKGTVKNGDTLTIDYEGSMNGKKFDGGSAEGQELVIGSGTMIKGFEEALVGAEIGKECEIEVTFPEDYGKPELAGKDAVFKINIKNKKVKEPVKYDTKFIKSVSDYDNKKDYEASVKKELLENKEKEAKDALSSELWGKIVEKSKIKKYPKSLLDEEIKLQKAQYKQTAAQYGTTPEQMGLGEDAYKTYAKQAMKEKIVLHAIADKENIKITKKDKEAFYKKTLKELGYTEKEFEKAAGVSIEKYFKENGNNIQILQEKVFDFIGENATVNEAE